MVPIRAERAPKISLTIDNAYLSIRAPWSAAADPRAAAAASLAEIDGHG